MGRRRKERGRSKRQQPKQKRSFRIPSLTNLPIWVWLLALIVALIFVSGVIVDYLITNELVVEAVPGKDMIRAGGNLLPVDVPIGPEP